jgi:alpha-mannosidase
MTRRLLHIAFFLLLAASAAAQTVPLAGDGTVPVWLAVGPFEQPLAGFGVPGDADAIGEADAEPTEGDIESSAWAEGGSVAWRPVAPTDGFVDFHAAFADVAPGDGPERIWWAKAGYAATTLYSEAAQDVLLLAGSNSRLKVLLNGEPVHAVDADRNAVADEDTVRLRLRPGANRLLVKVGQSHRNEAVQFFVPLEWAWGFYARLVTQDGTPADLHAEVALGDPAPEAALASSFFFREIDGALRQRYDLAVTRRAPGEGRGEARLVVVGETVTLALAAIPFGLSRHVLWGPPVETPTEATLDVRLDGEAPITQAVTLEPQPRVELHLMLNSHTDVGYTHPQPTVAEKHALLLDAVIEKAEAEPDFRWTVETIWQLEQFVEARSEAQVERLMSLIRAGRIAVSPVYANPFTGWVSEEELLRSFSLGHAYAERYGFGYRAAISNDEPGFSWMLPDALHEAGVSFFVAGLNEVFSDYAFQRALPKAFRWEGAGGGSVVTYRTEAYNEGQSYGLIKGIDATEDKVRERLQRLRTQGNAYDLVLVNATFGDNGAIPTAELDGARAWNAAYAYPRVVVSTLDDFAEAFLALYGDDLPTLRGDWTSDWDVLHQGELARTVRQRRAQHALPVAEALSTAVWLTDGEAPLQPIVDEAYHHLLQYSAHGSGLEYGYGSPAENAITMAYREGYVQNAVLATEAALQRATRRLVQPMESFETEALFVFNALGAERDAPVEVEFPREAGRRYRVVDPVTEEEIPSHQDGHVLRFVAPDLPALGYRKLRLEPRTEALAPTSLSLSGTTIENEYYRLAADPATGALASVTDRRTGAELVRAGAALPFGVPARSVFGDEAGFVPMDEPVTIRVEDERPARVRLVVERGGVVPRVTYTLWGGVDRVEVEAAVDLEALGPVEVTETVGLAFPFALDAPQAHLGLLGGFVRPEEDRLDGIGHDAFSLRQSLALTDAARSVSWAAADSRVVYLRDTSEPAPTVVAVLANHFPPAWNRNEENAGTWPLRFAFTHRAGGFDAAFTDGFGRAFAQPPAVEHTWLTAAEPVRPFLDVDGDPVRLLAFQPGHDDTVHVRLQNPRPDGDATVRVALPGRAVTAAERTSFLGGSPAPLPLDGDGVAVRLGPNELTTIRLRLGSAARQP